MEVPPLSAPNVEKLVVAYLSEHYDNVATRLPLDPQTPFIKVRRITGPETKVTDFPVVSIHSFHATEDGAGDLADDVHNLIMAWTPKITVSYKGSDYSIDYLDCQEKPIFVDYDNDNLQRFVGRYCIHLRVK